MSSALFGPRSSPKQEGSEGVALFLVLGYLAVMTVLLTAFLGALTHSMDRERAASKHLITLNIAEGGLHKALAALQMRPNGYRGEEATPLGEGRFTVEVREGDVAGTYNVISTGALGEASLAVPRVRIGALLGPKKGSLRILRWAELSGQARLGARPETREAGGLRRNPMDEPLPIDEGQSSAFKESGFQAGLRKEGS